MSISSFQRGQQLHASGELAAAEACYRETIANDPAHAAAAHYLGVVLMQGGHQAEALDVLRPLLDRMGAHPDTAALLALLCRGLGLYAEGIAAAGRALQARPDDAFANSLAGSLHVFIGDYPLAEQYLRKALLLDPREADAWHYLGITLHRQSRWPEAIAAYAQTSKLTPDDFRLHYNIGLCADAMGDPEAACTALEKAQQLSPQRVDILSRLASIQASLCDFEGESRSVAELEHALEHPGELMGDDQVEPFVLTFLPLSDQATATILRRKAEQVDEEASRLPKPSVRVEPAAGRPLRIGYISADFGEHAVGSLIQGLFRTHDRSAVTVHAYSLKRHAGPVAAELRSGADVFRDCDAMATSDIAASIADDRIDVLVDMAGYTLGARPAVLALRPAPVQLGYLGFLHEYAADWIDALIVDAVVAPPGTDAGCRDRLIRLPGTLFPGCHALAGGTPDRLRFGLPENAMIYASFNNSYKLDAELLQAWIAIGRNVPGAFFLVYVPPPAIEYVSRFWREQGGRNGQLLFAGKLPSVEHADRTASCDLFLDAFRYSAGATGVAALAAGLPLLCREGDTFASRFGTSLNRFLGLERLVCLDTRAYVDKAIAIGLDRALLESLKSEVRAAVGASQLLDANRIARAMEHVFRVERQRVSIK
ncbi:MAG: tetratricopeptide repeat protein [Lysobacteraceae bacterium]